MKSIKNILLAMTLILTISSCKKDDDKVVGQDELHANAKTYINTHFGDATITRVEKDREGALNEYEVYLSNGVKLEFDVNGAIENIESLKQLPDSVIPVSILTYVQANYPDQYIIEWELETNDQEVKLSNGLELKFTKAGEFIRIDQ
ncbi:putative periplasmic protein [Pedobacter sp. BAL39]|uniref:PepSY-like domain-containing protein n=1 Tax=Pedobacter sp. BAL39 TaxID=391596 RepID=UPI0001559CF2|nr:PepSY-like domain-containing protein [Pedobacter sp. BAL39]EDM36754.1 putative periplasmic protein [Pedobacter sp. BAL39]